MLRQGHSGIPGQSLVRRGISPPGKQQRRRTRTPDFQYFQDNIAGSMAISNSSSAGNEVMTGLTGFRLLSNTCGFEDCRQSSPVEARRRPLSATRMQESTGITMPGQRATGSNTRNHCSLTPFYYRNPAEWPPLFVLSLARRSSRFQRPVSPGLAWPQTSRLPVRVALISVFLCAASPASEKLEIVVSSAAL